MKYDPEDQGHRAALATAITTMLTDLGFKETPQEGCGEVVFGKESRRLRSVTMLVYTSIEGAEVREKGTDAIRVCAVSINRFGERRGLGSETRVHRTGQLEGIPDRIRDRIVDMAATLNDVVICGDCGAPTFRTKRGKACCTDFCWSR